MNTQLNRLLVGEELVEKLAILPPYRKGITDVGDRLTALLDIYKIFIPSQNTIDIYNRLYLALLNSLERKDDLLEMQLRNDNFRAVKGLKRYGVIGGLDSMRITGSAGLGKTSSVQRCIDIIADKVLIGESSYSEIVPILFVECVADGSFKSLLYSILQEVDRKIGTNFYVANKRDTITIDSLLGAVNNVLINHVAVLVIDEIERVANDSRKGETLINYLTQLVNQSNIAICFVGNESANNYFERKEYLSRRTVGLSMSKMEYNEYFYNFCRILFNYQYTEQQIQFTPEYARLLYKLSGGSPSTLVSLFVETQRNVILRGERQLTALAFENVFKNCFTTLLPYSELKANIVSKKQHTIKAPTNAESVDIEKNLFERIAKASVKNIELAIELLSKDISIEFC